MQKSEKRKKTLMIKIFQSKHFGRFSFDFSKRLLSFFFFKQNISLPNTKNSFFSINSLHYFQSRFHLKSKQIINKIVIKLNKVEKANKEFF